MIGIVVRVDEIQILLDQGRIALNQGRFDEASELIDRVLSEDAQNEQALNLRGLLLFKQDRFLEAVDLFGGLVEKYPEEPTLLMNLGLAYLKSEQYEQAIVELDKALERQPNNVKVLNYLGLAHSGLGNLGKAKEYFLQGGSTKMADQMLEMMKEKSGEVEEIDLEVDEDEGTGVDVDVGEEDTLDASFAQTFTVPVQNDAEPEAAIAPDPEPVPENAPEPEPAVEVAEEASEIGDAEESQAFAPVDVPQQISPTDLLGSAMSLLKDRYEMVLETAAAGKNLSELGKLLELAKDPDSPIDHIRSNLLRIQVQQDGVSLSRMSGLLALNGDVRAQPRQKRYKGKDINSTFGGEGDAVFDLVGSGSVYICARQGKTFFPLYLDGELVYVVEAAFFAMVGQWRWENGRLPGKDGADLHLVQVRGNGALALVLDEGEKLGAIHLTGQKLTLPAQRLAGWFGNIVPVVVDFPVGRDKQSVGAVQFQGDGTVLVKVPGHT